MLRRPALPREETAAEFLLSGRDAIAAFEADEIEEGEWQRTVVLSAESQDGLETAGCAA